MKNLVASLIVLISVTSMNSCKLLKHKVVDRSIQTSDIKNDISVNKSSKDSASSTQNHITETSNTVASEEINIKTPVNNSIELTAKFRIDTNASLKGDTALKLVDINNDDVSITIYQNKKTNELMAKVKTGTGTKTTSFSEMQIKRNYSNATTKTDSSKSINTVSVNHLDSVDKSTIKTRSETLHKEKNEGAKSDVWPYVFIAIGFMVLVIGYRMARKYFTHFF